MQARALIALVLVCASVYFVDDFVRKFGFRALPFGALALVVVCSWIMTVGRKRQ